MRAALGLLVTITLAMPAPTMAQSVKTRAGLLEVEGSTHKMKLTLNGKVLKRGSEIIYAQPESFPDRIEFESADVFVFSAYTSNICRYFFVVEVPSSPAKPKVHPETHLLCGGPQAEDQIEILSEGNILSLVIPDYYDIKTKKIQDKTYAFTIGSY